MAPRKLDTRCIACIHSYGDSALNKYQPTQKYTVLALPDCKQANVDAPSAKHALCGEVWIRYERLSPEELEKLANTEKTYLCSNLWPTSPPEPQISPIMGWEYKQSRAKNWSIGIIRIEVLLCVCIKKRQQTACSCICLYIYEALIHT